MESILILIIPVLMLSDYYLTLYSNRLRLDAYSHHVVLEVYELNPIFASDISRNKIININHLIGVLLVCFFLFWAHYSMDGSYLFKLVYGNFIFGFTLTNARHLLNIFIFKFVRNNPDELKGQISQSAKFIYIAEAGQDFTLTIAIAPLAILSGSFYLYGALIGGVVMTIGHIVWYRKYKKSKEISSNSVKVRSKSGPCFLMVLAVILIANEGYQAYSNKTNTKEKINVTFEPIASKYGIKKVTKESYDKGVQYAMQGKFKEAKKEFEKALEADVYNKTAQDGLKTINDVIIQKTEREAAIHLFKGVSFANKVQDDDAIKEFTKAIEISPRFVEAYLNLGLSYDVRCQYVQAIKEFSKAIEINPMNAQAYNHRGFTYRKKGEYDQAIKDYTKSIEINPTDVTTYINRGFVYDEKGQYDQATKDYTKAIEINPICKTMVEGILRSRPDPI